MFQFLINLFGIAPKIDFAELIKQGAVIIDVRTKNEYEGGHIKGSLNIPLNRLTDNLEKIKSKEQLFIVCCASGMRSATAKEKLKKNGYANVHDAGVWQNLRSFVK